MQTQNKSGILNHIAIPVDTEDEIRDFYGEILGFTEKYRFEIDIETSTRIFRIDKPIVVVVAEKDGLFLELYLNFKNDLRINHICLNLPDVNDICRNAESQGYEVIIIERPTGNLAFITDKSGNRFEIKQE
jgi:catechol 2,3-dioxygenase-like lactoylglutathione lyase family enzyme